MLLHKYNELSDLLLEREINTDPNRTQEIEEKMTTKREHMKSEAIDMIASLECRLRGMSADELELVTARLTDLNLEIGQRRHAALAVEADRLEAENAYLTGAYDGA